MHENAAGELFFAFFESGYELSDTVASFLGMKKRFAFCTAFFLNCCALLSCPARIRNTSVFPVTLHKVLGEL